MPVSWEEVKQHIGPDGKLNWKGLLDPRQEAEVRFSEVYAGHFHHGTDGHNAKMLIALLTAILDAVADNIIQQPDHK